MPRRLHVAERLVKLIQTLERTTPLYIISTTGRSKLNCSEQLQRIVWHNWTLVGDIQHYLTKLCTSYISSSGLLDIMYRNLATGERSTRPLLRQDKDPPI